MRRKAIGKLLVRASKKINIFSSWMEMALNFKTNSRKWRTRCHFYQQLFVFKRTSLVLSHERKKKQSALCDLLQLEPPDGCCSITSLRELGK